MRTISHADRKWQFALGNSNFPKKSRGYFEHFVSRKRQNETYSAWTHHRLYTATIPTPSSERVIPKANPEAFKILDIALVRGQHVATHLKSKIVL